MESIFLNMTDNLYKSLLLATLFMGGVFFLLFLGPYKRMFLTTAAITVLIYLVMLATGRV